MRVATTSKTVKPDARADTILVPAGPLYYFGGEYLDDEPDPNIRFQLLRDIVAEFGGDPEGLA